MAQVIGQGAISAPMFAMKGPSMVDGNYPTAFPLKHQQKVLSFQFPGTISFMKQIFSVIEAPPTCYGSVQLLMSTRRLYLSGVFVGVDLCMD